MFLMCTSVDSFVGSNSFPKFLYYIIYIFPSSFGHDVRRIYIDRSIDTQSLVNFKFEPTACNAIAMLWIRDAVARDWFSSEACIEWTQNLAMDGNLVINNITLAGSSKSVTVKLINHLASG